MNQVTPIEVLGDETELYKNILVALDSSDHANRGMTEAAWDGSNGEMGSRHTMTSWYWLLLTPPAGPRPAVFALIVIALIVSGELAWVRSASRSNKER